MKTKLRNVLILCAFLVMGFAFTASADILVQGTGELKLGMNDVSRSFRLNSAATVTVTNTYNTLNGSAITARKLNGFEIRIDGKIYSKSRNNLEQVWSTKNQVQNRVTLWMSAGSHTVVIYDPDAGSVPVRISYLVNTSASGIKLPNSVQMKAGDKKTVHATSNYGGSVDIYSASTSNSSVVTVAHYRDELYLTAVKEGTASVTVYDRYGGSASMTVKVKDSADKIALDFTSKTIEYGKPQINYLKNCPDPFAVKWTSTNKKIATVENDNGYAVITGQKVGSCQIKAMYNGKVYTCKIKVVNTKAPNFKISIVKINKNLKTVTIKVQNYANKKLVFDFRDYGAIWCYQVGPGTSEDDFVYGQFVGQKGGKEVNKLTVKARKTAVLTLKVKGMTYTDESGNTSVVFPETLPGKGAKKLTPFLTVKYKDIYFTTRVNKNWKKSRITVSGMNAPDKTYYGWVKPWQ